MHHFLYVWMDVCDVTKIHVYLTAWHMARACKWISLRSSLEVKVIGQRSRPLGRKTYFQVSFHREGFDMWSSNLVWALTWMTLRSTLEVKVKGQGHLVKKWLQANRKWLFGFTMLMKVGSFYSKYKIMKHYSDYVTLHGLSFDHWLGRKSPCNNFTYSPVWALLGQRSLRPKVTWVKVSPRLIILAGGLTSTSSCIFP